MYGSGAIDSRTAAEKHLDSRVSLIKFFKNKQLKGSKVRKAMFGRMIKKLEHEVKNHKTLFSQYYI